jgi:hypothetical protein
VNAMKILPTASAASKLFFTGSTVGTIVDSLHNQCLLRYNVAPITIEWPTFLNNVVAFKSNTGFLFNEFMFTSSWTVPFLLGIAYIVLGSIIPAFIQNFLIYCNVSSINSNTAVDGGAEKWSYQFFNGEGLAKSSTKLSLQTKAVLAVASTAVIIKFSEFLVLNPSFGNHILSIFSTVPEKQHSTLLFFCVAIQWILLDGSISSLLAASITAIGGPLSEIPFVAADVWEYLPEVSDKLPLANLHALIASNPFIYTSITSILGENFEILSISSVSEPCYFAVCLDAIALRRFFECVDHSEGR